MAGRHILQAIAGVTIWYYNNNTGLNSKTKTCYKVKLRPKIQSHFDRLCSLGTNLPIQCVLQQSQITRLQVAGVAVVVEQVWAFLASRCAGMTLGGVVSAALAQEVS